MRVGLLSSQIFSNIYARDARRIENGKKKKIAKIKQKV